jgi:hypothetical protein
MASFLKNLLILLGLVATVALGYYLYKQNAQATLETGGPLADKLEIESAQILSQLAELSAVELNGDIFYDPRFSSLTSVTPQISAEPVGSENPFEIN